jgi:CRP-like cAMP-binding protein
MSTTNQLSAAQLSQAQNQLRHTSLFNHLEFSSIAAITDHLALVTLSEGEVLFSQRQRAKYLYLLCSGKITLSRSSPTGSEKVIELVAPGSTFAEAVVFSRSRHYPVKATALVDSTVWSIDAEHYIGLLRQSTDACFAVMHKLSDMLFEDIAEIERLTLHSASERFIAYLLQHIQPGTKGRAVVKLDAPKRIIASRLSIAPATFSRSLAKLSRDGLLEVHDSDIHIRNVGVLQAHMTKVSF